MRVPGHLRQHVVNYNLEDWVDKECDLDTYFETAYLFEQRVESAHSAEPKVRDSAVVTLIATCLDEEMSLETYVLENPVTSYDTTKEGAFAPIMQAAGWLILRRYRNARAKGKWSPPETGGDA